MQWLISRRRLIANGKPRERDEDRQKRREIGEEKPIASMPQIVARPCGWMGFAASRFFETLGWL
jgi:hypothetical protein